MEETVKIDIPKGYEFVGVDDDNQQVVFEKIKPRYPKTYEECCEVLGLNTMSNDAQGYKGDLIIRFQELLIARDAYWKIAGEETGLGKPWEPDRDEIIYGITRDDGDIIKCDDCWGDNHVLEFPTREMRDAFYENFKELIDECKELL